MLHLFVASRNEEGLAISEHVIWEDEDVTNLKLPYYVVSKERCDRRDYGIGSIRLPPRHLHRFSSISWNRRYSKGRLLFRQQNLDNEHSLLQYYLPVHTERFFLA